MTRTLIQIAIVHTREDMGSLGQRLPVSKSYGRLAQALWGEIREKVRSLRVDWHDVKVYQDGLPDAGPEITAKVLADVQSANYDLLRWLVAQGAEVIGTESPSLMKEEYAHLQAVLMAQDATAQAKARQSYMERAGALLSERDAYIARRIAETLLPGQLGLLFIGQAHGVAKHLPTDVTVREFLHSPKATPKARQARTRQPHT